MKKYILISHLVNQIPFVAVTYLKNLNPDTLGFI